jgi:putative nucleotidyltransferase with HDIG domain
MPVIEPGLSNPILRRIIALLPADEPIYLVGGAVRDALLQRDCYDLDFVMPGDALKIARQLADTLGAAYFPLDTERRIARIVLRGLDEAGIPTSNRLKLDFSSFQGKDLLSDLRGRDFTFNAMAIDLQHPHTLVDPLGGSADLAAKRLKACSPTSFLDDPVRIMRAVRQAVDFNLKILPETLLLIRQAVIHIPDVSPERLRDELFRILLNPHAVIALRALDKVNAISYTLPEVSALKGIEQSPPHILDAWNHTLEVINRLESVLEVLALEYNPDNASNLNLGLVAIRLGRYRRQLAEHLAVTLNPDRPHRGLLFLAGLYHDVGKVETQSLDDIGKIRFFNHDQVGIRLVEKRGQALKLSNPEIERLSIIVNHHMRPSLLSHQEQEPSHKAIYRFFRDTGEAGVDICILSLADVLATYGPTLPQERWVRHLDVIRVLLEAWWEKHDESVLPPALLNGDDLMESLGLSPGPMIGYLLESIREAQVTGEVGNREQAIDLARELQNKDRKKDG